MSFEQWKAKLKPTGRLAQFANQLDPKNRIALPDYADDEPRFQRRRRDVFVLIQYSIDDERERQKRVHALADAMEETWQLLLHCMQMQDLRFQPEMTKTADAWITQIYGQVLESRHAWSHNLPTQQDWAIEWNKYKAIHKDAKHLPRADYYRLHLMISMCVRWDTEAPNDRRMKCYASLAAFKPNAAVREGGKIMIDSHISHQGGWNPA